MPHIMFTIALRDYWRIATAITATELELGSTTKKQVLYCVGSRKLGRPRALATAFQRVIPTLTATGGLLMNVCFYLDTLHEGGLVSEYPFFCILDPAQHLDARLQPSLPSAISLPSTKFTGHIN
jgi:hypothetical protein